MRYVMEKSSDRLIYLGPMAEIVEAYPEGILCASGESAEQTESLDELLGQW